MTITTFQRKCKPGNQVVNTSSNRTGRVRRISKDRDKALVEYGDSSVEWNNYYQLEFPTPNP